MNDVKETIAALDRIIWAAREHEPQSDLKTLRKLREALARGPEAWIIERAMSEDKLLWQKPRDKNYLSSTPLYSITNRSSP